MTSINLGVGDDIDFETLWLVDNDAIITGTATLTGVETSSAGVVSYVQSDLSLGATPHSLSMALLVDTWRYPLEVPDDWDGKVIKFTKVHSDPDTFPGVVNVRVGLIAGGTTTSPTPSAGFGI